MNRLFRRVKFAVRDRQGVRCHNPEASVAHFSNGAALFAVDIDLDIVCSCECVAGFLHLIRNRDFCFQSILHALDEVIELLRRGRGCPEAISIGNFLCILSEGRCQLELQSVIIAVGIDVHVLQPLDEVVAFLHFGREVHIDLVNDTCFVIGLCRIGVPEGVGVQIRICFLIEIAPHRAVKQFLRAVCLRFIHAGCIVVSHAGEIIGLNRNADCIRLEVGRSLILADRLTVVGFAALFPCHIRDVIQCIFGDFNGIKVKLLTNHRRFDAADFNAV